MNKNKKTVLVTGSSRGIGKSIAKVLCDLDYNVFICARDEEVLKEAALEIGASGFYPCDISLESSIDKLLAYVSSVAGGVDILINNAGAYVYSPIEKTTPYDLMNLINLNVVAVYNLARKTVSHMKSQKWGRIVNIGSISGVVGEGNASLYSMTKSSLIGLTKSLALELAQDNITVNTINPGWVNTDLALSAVDESDFSMQEELDMIPQRRFIEPVEVANLVKYLVSEESNGLTGQCVSLCAGLSVG